MSSIIWSNIVSDFNLFFADTVNSLTSISNQYYEAKDTIDLKNLSDSNYNGLYSVISDGIDSVFIATDKTMNDAYNTVIKIAYKVTLNGDKSTYDNAMSDVEEIIRTRLDPSTWGPTIVIITFVGSSAMEFTDNPDVERYGIVSIRFRVTGKTNLP